MNVPSFICSVGSSLMPAKLSTVCPLYFLDNPTIPTSCRLVRTELLRVDFL